MKIFVWKEIVEGLTAKWHSGGGLLIVAEDLFRAQTLASENHIDLGLPYPDLEFETSSAEEQVIVFPDAGCC